MLGWRRLRRERAAAVGWEWAVVVGAVELVAGRSRIGWWEPEGWAGWRVDRMVVRLGVERRPVGWKEAALCWDGRHSVEPRHLVVRWRCWEMGIVAVLDWVGCCSRRMDFRLGERLGAAVAVVVQD